MQFPSLSDIDAAVNFGANLVTLLLGVGAIVGVIFKRKQLALVLNAFAHAYITMRMSKIRETLSRLADLSYDNKPDRPKINALIGQLCGQIRPMLSDYPTLTDVSTKLHAAMDVPRNLTESHKRSMLFELEAIIEGLALQHQGKSFR